MRLMNSVRSPPPGATLRRRRRGARAASAISRHPHEGAFHPEVEIAPTRRRRTALAASRPITVDDRRAVTRRTAWASCPLRDPGSVSACDVRAAIGIAGRTTSAPEDEPDQSWTARTRRRQPDETVPTARCWVGASITGSATLTSSLPVLVPSNSPLTAPPARSTHRPPSPRTSACPRP